MIGKILAIRGCFSMNNSKDKEEKKYIYRPWITKNGQRIYAKTYGLKAFKIPVK